MTNQMDLYQQIIIEHNRKPRNFKKLDDASHSGEGFNPLCGDHVHVYLRLSADQVIEDVSFEGVGCAISKASASMMTAELKGKTSAEAVVLFQEFMLLIKGEVDPASADLHLGKLKIFAGISKYPSRIKCAGLAWHTLKGALEESPKPASTEE